jgi:hypothetical protein
MRRILILLISAISLTNFSASLVAQKMTLSDKIKLMDADENYQKEYWDAAYGLYKPILKSVIRQVKCL